MPDHQDHLIQQEELFSRIASRYDLMNHLMTGWQDIRWRRFAVQQLELDPAASLLDIGSGNGQLINEANRQYPDCRSVGADLTQAMLEIGKNHTGTNSTTWTRADSENLPFDGNSFDGVISGFLVRNLQDVFRGIQEQYRVLKPGGRISVLDTSRPPRGFMRPLIRFYLNRVIPTMGGLLTGQKSAYNYLSSSTEGFLSAGELAAYLAAAGFKKVAYRQFNFGMITVHWGIK
jgi:demethylmenaquinone methyltransferase/2-methoxy-6-polyprenyl-1,4-benzoquinol methylase